MAADDDDDDELFKTIKVTGSMMRSSLKLYENKQKFRHIPEIIMNLGDLSPVDREIAADYVEHIPMPPQFSPNREGFKQFVGMLRTAFPDLHYDINHLTSDDLIGENQKVVHRITAHATHTGPWGPIPPTGKRMTWTEIHIGLFVGGMLVEHWGNIDSLGIMQQMGVIPGWMDKPPVPPIPQFKGQPTTYKENSAAIRRYVSEVWNHGKLEVADELVHPQGVSASLPYLPVGPEGVKMNVMTYRKAFPNLYLHILDTLAEENSVCIRFTMLGTHQGEFMGIPATGRDVEMEGCCIFSFGDGRIIEHWQESDMLSLLGQLGAGG